MSLTECLIYHSLIYGDKRKFKGETKRIFLYNPATIKKNIYKANATEMKKIAEVQLLYRFTQSLICEFIQKRNILYAEVHIF